MMRLLKRLRRKMKPQTDSVKTEKRLEQEQKLIMWKRKSEKISISALEIKLSDLEQKMSEHPFCEFDEQISEIEDAITQLPIKQKLLFEYEMGYKFSKSDEELRKYFAEGLYIDYPEMSYVKAQDETGLSFIVNKERLLICAIYGNQLTQIPLNLEHPYYSYLESANIKYRGLVFDEYFSDLVLTGKNISLKNPYVLKEIMQYSNVCNLQYFLLEKVANERSISEIYKEIGYAETADFCNDIKRMIQINGWDNVKSNIDKLLPDNGESILDMYCDIYLRECKQINKKGT